MNLGDPELELIDPTPNVYILFIHFDKLFFWTKLASRAVVRWSKKMYSCAGICSYDRGGLCDIALSEPLLKLRPRKDLIETLLHEMIHAFLFITNRDRDRDGHGPNFQSHMHRINKAAGLNISIYHDFHDEVNLYRTHWWRCNGPCQTRKPYFGIVRRTCNRAPGPSDYWWNCHKKSCGGTFIKIQEPEKKSKKPTNKPKGDITKYINTDKLKDVSDGSRKPLQTVKSNKQTNNKINTINDCKSPDTGISKNGTLNTFVMNSKINSTVVFSGKGEVVGSNRNRSNSLSAGETVRNIWANKNLIEVQRKNNIKDKSNDGSLTGVPIKQNVSKVLSPPMKETKIEDYFKKASSILKDVYGQDFKISKKNNKLIANETNEKDTKHIKQEKNNIEFVECPICHNKISNTKINTHLDECLNKDVIINICKNETQNLGNLRKSLDTVLVIPEFKGTSSIESKEKKSIAYKRSLTVDYLDLTGTYSNNDFNQSTDGRNPMKKIKAEETFSSYDVKIENIKDEICPEIINNNVKVKIEPKTTKVKTEISEKKCACCNLTINKSIDEHLDECSAFNFNKETASTSSADVIVIEDDEFDESFTMNATGTKTPCPCCLKMVEQDDMNDHLDECLS